MRHDHNPAIAIVVNEKVYRKLDTAEGPKRVLERTQTTIGTSNSKCLSRGTPTALLNRWFAPTSTWHSPPPTHVVLYLKQGTQAAEITKADCEGSMVRNGLSSFRAYLAAVKIERTAADGTVVSGSSESNSDSIHIDLAHSL